MENKRIQHKKIEFQIPKEGSLGILALGSVGTEKWRIVRDQSKTLDSEKT